MNGVNGICMSIETKWMTDWLTDRRTDRQINRLQMDSEIFQLKLRRCIMGCTGICKIVWLKRCPYLIFISISWWSLTVEEDHPIGWEKYCFFLLSLYLANKILHMKIILTLMLFWSYSTWVRLMSFSLIEIKTLKIKTNKKWK